MKPPAPPEPSALRWLRALRRHWLPIVLLLFLALQVSVGLLRQAVLLPYSDFTRELRDGRVREVRVFQDRLEGTLDRPEGPVRFVTWRVDPTLARELEPAGVPYAGANEGSFAGLLAWTVPALLLGGFWLLALRGNGRGGAGRGFLPLGKGPARTFAQEQDVGVTFDDVAGVDEAKLELAEVVEFLKDPRRHSRLGARMPKGILLVGPPGTGKTLLARAVAGQAGVPFYSINGSEFVEMFVGVGAARVRELFEQARRTAPCIVFIDEIDAIGRARGTFAFGGQDEKEQTLNQLLAEVDGFDPSAGVVLLAATNRPEILDAALLRAGRFDRQVLLDPPDRPGRMQILAVHVRKLRLAPDVDVAQVAALTPGFTGADLANLANEAALLATRRDAPAVTADDFTRAIERIVAGLEKRHRLLTEPERRIIATHEMGHVLVSMSLPGSDRVHKVSIIPRGIGALGYTLRRPTEDRYLMTRGELVDRMAVLLGGRAAEALLLNDVSTGAEDDLVRATEIARSMVMRYGMDASLGHVAYERSPSPLLPVPEVLGGAGHPAFAEETGREIDRAVQRLVDDAHARARGILAAREDLLREGARLLLAHETLDERQLAHWHAGDPAAATAA